MTQLDHFEMDWKSKIVVFSLNIFIHLRHRLQYNTDIKLHIL